MAKKSLSDAIDKSATRQQDRKPHLIIIARAGTGKTTTLIQGMKGIKGKNPCELEWVDADGVTQLKQINPSSQQEVIWAHLVRIGQNARYIAFVAFNKSIATELQKRVPEGCRAMTMHSMGYSAVLKAFGQLRSPDGNRVQNIICELLGKDIWDMRKTQPALLKATARLVSLCKTNLVESEEEKSALDDLASHYDVDLNGCRDQVYDLVPRVLDRCLDVAKDGYIDYDDMIWLPIALQLPLFKHDLLLVDEAQDLNRVQQELAQRCSRTLVLCGDPRQAIYGFAGADSNSIPNMEAILQKTPNGCTTLPLTMTYRCGKSIVAEAQRLVPDFEAHEDNPDGAVTHATMGSYSKTVTDADMVLCRVTAPLVSACFKFIRDGRKAIIQGRDIGRGLVSTVNKMKATEVVDLIQKLDEWLFQERTKENAKRHPNEDRLIALEDRVACLHCFCDGAISVDQVISKIEQMFTDDKTCPGIMLSSVHKAKGLEANRVFLLRPVGSGIPHPMASSPWQVEQEYNLLYVAITRAIHELIYVD